MRSSLASLLSLLALGAAARASAQKPEHYSVPGTAVAIYDLAGTVEVRAGTGSDVQVDVTRGGRDAGKLTIGTGEIRGRQTLRVIFPDDDIVYRGANGECCWNTTLDVSDDGTFNDEEHHGRHWMSGGHRVRINGRGDGLEAWADVVVSLPAGKRIGIYVGVGKATVTNVSGDLELSVSAADVSANGVVGSLGVDAGSGEVTVDNVQGDVDLDTGSGEVDLTKAKGTTMKLDTGACDVTAADVQGDRVDFETGSGSVDATAVTGRDVKFDTGSGDVTAALVTSPDILDIDTGSGAVTLTLPAAYGAHVLIDTGSGGIDLGGIPVQVTKLESDHIEGTIGDGKGRLHIDTGSGGVKLRKSM